MSSHCMWLMLGRRRYLSFILDENGLDVVAFCTDGDGNLVEADARIASGVF